MEKTLLRPDEAADILGISRWTIYRWVAEGRIRGTKIGKGEQNRLYFPSHPDGSGAS